MGRGKYKRLPDLFVSGRELVFEDGTVMWLQVMNPFEVEEARRDASAARSRLIMALREIGTPEYDSVRGAFYTRTRPNVIDDMIKAKSNKIFMEAQQSVEVDPEWKERLEIARRFDETPPAEDAEVQLFEKINRDWLEAVTALVNDETDYQVRKLESLSEEDLLKEYEELWLEAKGSEAALRAYHVAEVFYGARCCDAVPDEDGKFTEDSHAKCNHRVTVYESKDEVREVPSGLWATLRTGFEQISMSDRDARFSPRQESSSESSPLPSAAEESTPSTPDATPATPPGT